jgi:hypothetical protein
MKKGAILALAGLMAASASYATEERAGGFGRVSLFLADSSDWKSLPQTVNGNSITFEGIDGNLDWMGINKDVFGGSLGVYNGRDSWDIFSGSVSGFNIANPVNGGDPTPDNQYGQQDVTDLTDLIFAINLSDAARLAVGLTWGNNINNIYDYSEPSNANNYYKANFSSSVTGISLGADLKELGPIAVLQIGLQYHMWNQLNSEDYYTTQNTLNKVTIDNTKIALRVGGDLAGENGAFGRFELGVAMEGSEQKSAYQTALPANSFEKVTGSQNDYILGYASGISGDKGMIVVGVALTGQTSGWEAKNYFGAMQDGKMEEGEAAVVVSAGGEANYNSWVTLRGGVDANVLGGSGEKFTYTDGNTPANNYTDTYTYDNQFGANLNLGATVRFGNFAVDGTVNQAWVVEGPDFLSGAGEDIFFGASVTYALGN